MSKWNIFSSLSNRAFAFVWIGQTFSRLGDQIYQIALAWWVLEKTGSAADMATVLILSYAPTILFSLIGGVAVDRFPRLSIMLACDVIRGFLVLLVTGLAWINRLEIWHVYLLSTALGIVDTFFQPAYAACVPDLVNDSQLTSANSLTSLSSQAGRVIGPLIGAGLITAGGTSLAFGGNAVSFLIAACMLVPLLYRSSQMVKPTCSSPSKFITDIQGGLRLVFGQSWLWISILIFSLCNVTLGGPFGVALPFLVKDQLKADAGTLGMLYALFAAGYVLGSLWMGQKQQLHHRGTYIYGGILLAGVMLLMVGLPIGMVGISIAALINGAALELAGQAWTNSLQTMIPHEKLGRVISLDNAGSFALVPIGYAAAGYATSLLGAQQVLIIGGGVTGLFAALAFLHPDVRQLNQG